MSQNTLDVDFWYIAGNNVKGGPCLLIQFHCVSEMPVLNESYHLCIINTTLLIKPPISLSSNLSNTAVSII